MTTREALHALIDELPEDELPLAEARLLGLGTPYPAGIPYDDEPYTEEDARISRERRAAYKRGEFVTMSEALKQIQAS